MADSVEFYSLYLKRFVDNLGYVAILTLLPAFINQLNPSGLAIGVFVSALAIGRTIAVGTVLAAEKFTNMLFQPYTGGLSDTQARALFIFVGGGLYGAFALAMPFAPAIGSVVPLSVTLPLFGTLPPVFFVALALNGLLGVADRFREPASMALFADERKGSGITSSFSIRGIVWRLGAILAPLVGGWIMSTFGID
jgi:MFS family permease